MPGQRVEVLQHRDDSSWWERRWLGLPAGRRRAVSIGSALVLAVPLAVAALVQGQGWWVEQGRREVVDLDVSLGVWTSSTSPPTGYVSYYLAIRNAGIEPLEITSVQATGEGLQVRARGDGGRQVEAGGEIVVPLSALLTCSSTSAAAGRDLRVEVGVRRDDGRQAPQRSAMDASLILDAAQTLCGVRPGLRAHELSGPVLSTPLATEEG